MSTHYLQITHDSAYNSEPDYYQMLDLMQHNKRLCGAIEFTLPHISDPELRKHLEAALDADFPASDGQTERPCTTFAESISGYLLGSLSDEQGARFEQHALLCPACYVLCEQVKQTVLILKGQCYE